MHRWLSQQGASLLEVQLALAILALGLGLIGQWYLALGQQARLIYERQQAQQVLEQMLTVLPYYQPQLALLSALADNPMGGPPACSRGRPCSAEAMLADHWRTWQGQLDEVLVHAHMQVRCASACVLGDRLTMEVIWGGDDSCYQRCVSLTWEI